MLAFTHPDLVRGALAHSMTRNDGNQYILVLSKPSGLIYTREISRLNISTPPSWKSLPLSPDGRPYLWLDCSTDRGYGGLPNGVLAALTASEPKSVVKPTGRKQIMAPPEETGLDSDPREVQEVELLLSEDELLHSCYYCGDLEIEGNGGIPFVRIGGTGYASTYGCASVRLESQIFRASHSKLSIVYAQVLDK
jgi:hypothetical protein